MFLHASVNPFAPFEENALLAISFLFNCLRYHLSADCQLDYARRALTKPPRLVPSPCGASRAVPDKSFIFNQGAAE